MESKLEVKREPNSGISTYQGGHYCGPGWGFTLEDVRSGRIKELPAAIDAIDAACKNHDQCYADSGYFSIDCNRKLISELTAVVVDEASSPQQRQDAAIMAAIFAVEVSTVDIGIAAYRCHRDFALVLLENSATFELVINQIMLRRKSQR
jgi:hypothetical protein